MGKSITLSASDGHSFSAYRADPAGKPRGGIVVIQEIFGVNSHVRQVADGYAADGYLAIAPALFDRIERGVDIGYTPDDIQTGVGLKGKVSVEMALMDTAAAIQTASEAGRVGIVGYCWGGYVTWMAAARARGLACAVPYYGGGVTGTIEEQPKCPVMLHFGDKDTHIPLEGVEKLKAAHPKQTVHVYAAEHGFNCDHRGSYNAAAAKLARERTLEFFGKHIG
jgi:carboxymethylenebutenolidase